MSASPKNADTSPTIKVDNNSSLSEASASTPVPPSLQQAAKQPRTPLSTVQPFGDYVARVFHVTEESSSMYELIVCCATLYLFRSDPQALRRLTSIWADFSLSKHETKVKRTILLTNSSFTSPSSAFQQYSSQDEVCEDPVGSPASQLKNSVDDLCKIEPLSEEERSSHLLSVLQSCVDEYFNSNWNEIKKILSINRQFREYVTNEILPRVVQMANAEQSFNTHRRSTLVQGEECEYDTNGVLVPISREEENTKNAAGGFSPKLSQVHQSCECSPAGMAAGYGDFLLHSPANSPVPQQLRQQEQDKQLCSASKPTASLRSNSVVAEDPTMLIQSDTLKVPPGLNWVGEDSLQQLRLTAPTHGIVLFFHALFSEPSSTALQNFAKAYAEYVDQHGVDSVASFAVVNSASQVDLFRQYKVTWYPYIVYIPPLPTNLTQEEALTLRADTDGHCVYPEDAVNRNGKYVLDWILSHGTAEPKEKKIKQFITRVVNLDNRLKYKKFRALQSSILMLKELQCVGNSCEATMQHDERSDPPTFIFLGGGMAAGKTTAVTAFTRTSWWQKYGNSTVVVNADEFKVRDPMFAAKGADDLHRESTQAAEQLLVNAINQGRDIVFDGTMSWVPFVRQTVEMVRNAHSTLYKCGQGYLPEENIEEYFVPVGPREKKLALPYRIKLIAIFVEPHIAIPRAILRQLTTERGVPVGAQLRSFRLFAEGFPEFCEMCDEVTLYNNNVWIDLEKGEQPQITAIKTADDDDSSPSSSGEKKKNSGLQIVDEEAWDMFMRHKRINPRATGTKDLFVENENEQLPEHK